MLGMEVRADRVVIDPDGAIVMHGVVMRAPGVAGEAGEVVRLRWLRAEMDWSGLFGGGPVARSIEVRGEVLRVSEDATTGVLNIASLDLFRVASKRGAMLLPTILASDIELELGEHDGLAYRVLRRIGVEGSLEPTLDETGYRVSLRQVVDGPSAGTDDPMLLTLTGTISSERMEFELTNLSLAGWPAISTPTSVRRVIELLDLDGAISGAKLVIDDRWSLTAQLDGVGLSLPFDREGRYTDEGPRARMTGVTGALTITPDGVSAEFEGQLEDLLYHVSLEYRGFDADAPFTVRLVTRGFRLTRDPTLLAFVPPMVARYLGRFNNPTAELDADVVLVRTNDPQGGPGPIKLNGWLHLRHGEAAYEVFPLTIRNLSGTIAFTQDQLSFDDLSGEISRNGRVSFSGLVAPLTNEAEATIRFKAQGIVIDDELRRALGPKRQFILDIVLNQDRLDQLVENGLVRTESNGVGDDPRPFVELGGEVSIEGTLHRPLGVGQPWSQVIDLHLEELTLLPRAFAMPVLGRDITVRLTEDSYELLAGSFTTISGGRIVARVKGAIPRRSTTTASMIPVIDLEVTGQPPDAIALFAAAHAGPTIDRTDRGWLERVLTGLSLDGTVSARVQIAPDAEGKLALDVTVTLDDLAMAPDPLGVGSGMRIEIARGTLGATLEAITVDLTGSFDAPFCEPTSIAVRTTIGLNSPARPFDATIEVERLEAPIPAESLIAVFSPETARRVAVWRAKTRPSGAARTVVHLVGDNDTPTRTTITLAEPEMIELSTRSGRIGLDGGSGTVSLHLGERVVFESLETALSIDHQDQGTVGIDGVYALEGALKSGVASEPMRVTLADGRFESRALRALVADEVGPAMADWFERANPRGRFDGTAVLVSGDPRGLFVSGTIQPHNLTFEQRGTTITMEQISGSIHLDRSGATTPGLMIAGSDWAADLTGTVVRADDGAISLGGTLSMQSTGLSDALRAMLPDGVLSAIHSVELAVAGPMTARIDRLIVDWSPDGAIARTESAGSVTIQDATAEVGVDLTGMLGTIDFSTSWARGQEAATIDVRVALDEAIAGGVRITNASARIVNGVEPETTAIQRIQAACYGGVIAGDAMLFQHAGETVRRYALSLWASDVQLGPVLADLRRADEAEAGAAKESAGPDSTPGRGLLNAELSLAGVVGDASARRGRGSFLIGQGDVVTLPLVLTLVRVSNLHLPGSGTIDLAMGDYFIEGQRVIFEQLSAFAGSIELYGLGTMDWPTRQLDLRFTSRAVAPVPLVTELVEGVRNQLMTLRVTGTTSEPKVVSEALPGASNIARRLLGQQTSALDRRLGQIQRRASSGRDRIARAGARVRLMARLSHDAVDAAADEPDGPPSRDEPQDQGPDGS